jgi:hypothetical protein
MPQSPIDYRTPIDYQSHRPNEWVIVGSFATASDWHRAAQILNRVQIMTRLESDGANPSASGLAVPAAEADIARQLLTVHLQPAPAAPDAQLHAFPVVMAPVPGDNASRPPPLPPMTPSAMAVIPVRAAPPGGSQEAYIAMMAILWLILIVIGIACIAPLL